MAENAKKNNKNLIIGICCVVAAVVIVAVVAVMVVTKGGGSMISDSYFVSDGTKYVITLETSGSSGSDIYTPIKIHTVYTYDGDKVTGQKMYYEYADATTAQGARDYIIKEEEAGEYKEVATDGKYVVFIYKDSDYEDLTVSDVKNQIEFLENLKNLQFDDTEEDIEVDADTVETTQDNQ